METNNFNDWKSLEDHIIQTLEIKRLIPSDIVDANVVQNGLIGLHAVKTNHQDLPYRLMESDLTAALNKRINLSANAGILEPKQLHYQVTNGCFSQSNNRVYMLQLYIV